MSLHQVAVVSEPATARIAQAIADLDAWLETMRQPGGYGGPVPHWWQSSYRYTGPGLDWRYEGILAGYALLYEKTGAPCWRQRLNRAAEDLRAGQRPDGSFRGSCFEKNPGALGTPHEAAATLGLFRALPHLDEAGAALDVTRKNLDNLVARLWDPETQGFNDLPGIPGRVPNKLATLAQALMTSAEVRLDDSMLRYAQSALDDVVRYQRPGGPFAGAMHQMADASGRGDGRFFPYYIARCVAPLLQGACVFGERRYADSATAALDFIERSMAPDGSWPQIVYAKGGRATWPRWIAGVADIALALRTAERQISHVGINRILDGQLPSGGFRTARGFGSLMTQREPPATPDYRDITPAVGWNDKVLRLLATLLPDGAQVPAARVRDVEIDALVGREQGRYVETPHSMSLTRDGHATLYRWNKPEPWAEASLEVARK